MGGIHTSYADSLPLRSQTQGWSCRSVVECFCLSTQKEFFFRRERAGRISTTRQHVQRRVSASLPLGVPIRWQGQALRSRIPCPLRSCLRPGLFPRWLAQPIHTVCSCSQIESHEHNEAERTQVHYDSPDLHLERATTPLSRTVIDKTGITGEFHIQLNYTPDTPTVPFPVRIGLQYSGQRVRDRLVAE